MPLNKNDLCTVKEELKKKYSNTISETFHEAMIRILFKFHSVVIACKRQFAMLYPCFYSLLHMLL